MSDPRLPTEAELEKLMNEGRNWGRWGENGAKGTMNLVTPEKVVQAASLVKKGRQVSLSQVFPTCAGPENERPALHYTYTIDRGLRGEACDFYGTDYHTVSTTHVDALNHLWDVEGGGWDGADPDKMITTRGATSGGIEAWSDGIVTRGVFLNVPKYRGVPCVTPDNPVLNWELDDIVDQLGIEVGPGDAAVVYSGRGAAGAYTTEGSRPGVGASCNKFLRERDIAVLAWDMHDAFPNEYGTRDNTPHTALYRFGIVLLDSCLLEPLAQACEEEGRYEFMLTAAPLNVVGGTGSPLNPIAIF